MTSIRNDLSVLLAEAPHESNQSPTKTFPTITEKDPSIDNDDVDDGVGGDGGDSDAGDDDDDGQRDCEDNDDVLMAGTTTNTNCNAPCMPVMPTLHINTRQDVYYCDFLLSVAAAGFVVVSISSLLLSSSYTRLLSSG